MDEFTAHLLDFLAASLGESLWEDRDLEVSLCDLSDRSDFGEGDLPRLLLLLRDGLGEPLWRFFLEECEQMNDKSSIRNHFIYKDILEALKTIPIQLLLKHVPINSKRASHSNKHSWTKVQKAS